MKITKSSPTINPFGGINFVIEALKKAGLAQLIDNQLGGRSPWADYSYSEVLTAHWCSTLCGGERLEDAELLRSLWGKIPGFLHPSSDTIGRVMKDLAIPDLKIISDTQKEHRTNNNPDLNRLLLRLICHFRLLDKEVRHAYDFDHVICEHEKYDSQKTYQYTNGSQPGVGLIGKLPVYVVNRTGNSPAKFEMADSLRDSFDHLDREEIKIGAFRSDSAAYQKEVFELVEKRADNFYIRMRSCGAWEAKCSTVSTWTKGRLNYCDYEFASIEYTPTGMKKSYRVVVYRTPGKSNQINLLTQDTYIYLGIITTDRIMGEMDLVGFYNQRGSAETNFDALKNDFNWSRLPFSDLCDNTVFMILGAICKVLYIYLIELFSKKVSFLKPNFRLKNFLFHFMIVPTKWISKGRQKVLKIYSGKDYEKCLI